MCFLKEGSNLTILTIRVRKDERGVERMNIGRMCVCVFKIEGRLMGRNEKKEARKGREIVRKKK